MAELSRRKFLGGAGALAVGVGGLPAFLAACASDSRTSPGSSTGSSSEPFKIGALIPIPYSYRHPREYVAANVTATLNVLEASRRTDVARIVQVSSSEVYAELRLARKNPSVHSVLASYALLPKLGTGERATPIYSLHHQAVQHVLGNAVDSNRLGRD